MARSDNTSNSVSRRKWLQAMGLTGTAALAGCSGGDDSATTTDAGGNNDGSDSENTDREGGDNNSGTENQRLNYMRGGILFADINWNQFSEQHNGTVKNFLDTVSALTRDADGQITALGYTDWSYDSDSQVMSVTLRDDITFWNGDQYTAEDLWTFEELLRLQNPEGSNYESIEVVDDLTLEYTTKTATNPDILFRTDVAETWLEFGADVWGEWLERYQDASNQDARDEITADLVEWEISSEQLVDEGLGTGAYIIDDITDEYMDLVAYEDHPFHAGNDDRWDPNIQNIRMWYADETGRRDQFILNERVDFAGHGHSWNAFKGQLPNYWEQVLYAPTINARKMIINWRNREYLQDVNFRRAMAAAMSFKNLAINTEEFEVEIHSGMGKGFHKDYWDEEIPSNFIDYGLEADYDLADEYLARSGYERDGGQIYDSDGNSLDNMRFIIGGGPWGAVAQTASQQLEQFGFPIDARPVDRSTKLDIVTENMGEWELSTETHYAGITQHPHEYYRPNSFWGWRIGPAGFGPEEGFDSTVQGWLDDGETHSKYNGKPMVFEIPTEVGSENLDGDTKEINIYELYNEIRSPVDEERNREIIRDLSWAWNYMLPDIDCTFAVADTFGNTKKIEFGTNEELQSYNPTKWPELGHVRLR